MSLKLRKSDLPPGPGSTGAFSFAAARASMSAMSIFIRDSTEADLTAIVDIYAPAVLHGTASFEIEPPDVAEMTRRRQALVTGGHPYLVAEMDGRIAGYAYAGPYRPRSAYRFTVEDSIYIAPDAHRRGVGRALLGALISGCAARGFREMIAVIGDSAQTPSIALHESYGFRLIGIARNVGFKHGRFLDQVLMQRSLG